MLKNVIGNDSTVTPLKAIVLKEGVVVAAGERSPQKKPSHKKTPRAGDLGKEGTVTHR
jgi:hypothetical protein